MRIVDSALSRPISIPVRFHHCPKKGSLSGIPVEFMAEVPDTDCAMDQIPAPPPCKDQYHTQESWYGVPHQSIVSVEHPYIIRNLDKGIESLGGIPKLRPLLHQDETTPSQARLYQKPGNRNSKPLHSQLVKTQNHLLKISIPKRTGRKRKRGSDDAYQDTASTSSAPNPELSGQSLARATTKDHNFIRSMRDNPERITIDPVGIINQTHRFRSLPDFVQSTADSPFMQKMKETILPFDFQKMKQFKLDMSKGIQKSNEIIPPPRWSQAAVPFHYAYRQNPGVYTVVDTRGNLKTRNNQIAPRSKTQEVAADALQIPAGPSPDLPSISTLEPALQRIIAEAEKLLRLRPVFTRRALGNCIPGDEWRSLGQNVTKYLFQYVGYAFNRGPWQNAVIRFGYDPRSAPENRIYQTFTFLLEPRDQYRRGPDTGQRPTRTRTPQEIRRESHVFDGVNISRDGKTWQVCDVTDPVLREVLATKNLREKCHIESDGWYHHGTLAKLRTIMKHKIRAILRGTQRLSDESYAKVAFSLPDLITKDNRPFAKLTGDGATGDEIALVNQIRLLYHAKDLTDDGQEDAENENANENELEEILDLGSD